MINDVLFFTLFDGDVSKEEVIGSLSNSPLLVGDCNNMCHIVSV
jgi:hypothetical protein